MGHLVLGSMIFLFAILSFLLVDAYHRARRVWQSARSETWFPSFIYHLASGTQPYRRFATRDEISRGHYYQWRVGTMLRVHMEDAVSVCVYISVLLAVCVALSFWVIQYWLAKWLLG